MSKSPHLFHIPVMGTGHSIDTPIRVAPFGIDSVISLVDDLLFEPLRKHYSQQYDIPYTSIPRNAEDGRARRTTAYLNMVNQIVAIKFNKIKNLPFGEKNDKQKYFEMLPDSSKLKKDYHLMLIMSEGPEKTKLQDDLTQRMVPGSIDVNIMVKLDRLNYAKNGELLAPEFSDAKSALRGYANSDLESSIVFSAGINQALMTYMTEFKDFYRDESGHIKKKIILKVSDYRSTLIQGKFLARKGLEVYEFRIESGLNCGGHAFASNGYLLPALLKEFKDNRHKLADTFMPMVLKYYEAKGMPFPAEAQNKEPLLTVQGGIGTNGEKRRMMEYFGMEATGWASPFLLVPEATCVDEPTRQLLIDAKEEDLYLSDVSPLGIPFNNVRNSFSEQWTQKLIDKNEPGSPCPKKFLVSNTEFTEMPICHASKEYQSQKIAKIREEISDEAEQKKKIDAVTVKSCICDHLGNGALIELNIIKSQKNAPAAICPGPNLAWFNRKYSLQEMVDHIYGRIPSLVPENRIHMFAKEIMMYVDYYKKLIDNCGYTEREISTIIEYKLNMEEGMDLCLEIAKTAAYPDENIQSVTPIVNAERARLKEIYTEFAAKASAVTS